MTKRVILTLVGSDRPGLTELLASAVTDAGGNWAESHLAVLGGHYVGSVLVEVPEAGIGALKASAEAIDARGLRVHVLDARAETPAHGVLSSLEIVGQDRPGIVHEVTAALARAGVNIEEFRTSVENSSWSGDRLFRAEATLRLPPHVSEEAVRESLEQISAEIMVDFALETAAG